MIKPYNFDAKIFLHNSYARSRNCLLTYLLTYLSTYLLPCLLACLLAYFKTDHFINLTSSFQFAIEILYQFAYAP